MKNLTKTLLSTALLATSLNSFATDFTQPVQTTQGQLRGVAESNMNAYMGIPYAQPPVGELRWQPPKAGKSWEGVRDAVSYGASCPQNADLGVFAKAGGKEDCLTLNVFTPKDMKAGEKRPVLVWIHGGSLFVGQGADYDPTRLVEQGSIVVTLNYRLALLGLLRTSGNDEKRRSGRELRLDGPKFGVELGAEKHRTIWRQS